MIRLVSTDFDGTLFAEFEDPPVPVALQEKIAELQEAGGKWVINTGRDLTSLMDSLGRARLRVRPDFLVLVEREIYYHENSEYIEDARWNDECTRAHAALFKHVEADVPKLRRWIEERFNAIFYVDEYSPFCLIAQNHQDADLIHTYLENYCRSVPTLTVVRNDVCSRFSHEAYNKGTALAELQRQLGITPEETFAAGDWLNDLPMLSQRFARYLAAPSNAIDRIKEVVREQNGFVSGLHCGHGVMDGWDFHLTALAKL